MCTGSKRFLSQFIFLGILLLSGLTSLVAQDFVIEDTNCLIRVKKETDRGSLEEIFQQEFKKKNFKTSPLIDNKRILAGELYATFEVKKGPQKLYKKCSITVMIQKARGNRPSPSDPQVFRKTNSRTVPRITFAGSERCNRAIKEAFIHMPKCVEIGFAGEKK